MRAKRPANLWKLIKVRRDKVIVYLVEAVEPKRRELIQDRAFVRNRFEQNHVRGGKPVGRDEDQRFAKIENFTHFPAAQFFDAGKID
jgi:hypothetical protein